jgi:hypothetical protein
VVTPGDREIGEGDDLGKKLVRNHQDGDVAAPDQRAQQPEDLVCFLRVNAEVGSLRIRNRRSR